MRVVLREGLAGEALRSRRFFSFGKPIRLQITDEMQNVTNTLLSIACHIVVVVFFCLVCRNFEQTSGEMEKLEWLTNKTLVNEISEKYRVGIEGNQTFHFVGRRNYIPVVVVEES